MDWANSGGDFLFYYRCAWSCVQLRPLEFNKRYVNHSSLLGATRDTGHWTAGSHTSISLPSQKDDVVMTWQRQLMQLVYTCCSHSQSLGNGTSINAFSPFCLVSCSWRLSQWRHSIRFVRCSDARTIKRDIGKSRCFVASSNEHSRLNVCT